MKYTPRLPQRNVNVTPGSPLRDFLVLLLGLTAILVGLYFLLGLAVNLIVPWLPMDIENRLAAPIVRRVVVKKDVPGQEAEVQRLLDYLQTECTDLPYRFTIHVSDNPHVNALALPGGNIVVFSGLLDKLKSENELTFVLAHEMGHYAHRDHLKGLGRALVFMTLSAVVFGSDNPLANFLSHGLYVTELNFSRDQETAADEYALVALNCTYGHVSGAGEFLRKIDEGDGGGNGGHYFSSHPETSERIAHLKDFAKMNGLDAGPLAPLPADFNL